MIDDTAQHEREQSEAAVDQPWNDVLSFVKVLRFPIPPDLLMPSRIIL